ncbi:response regulator [Pseudobacteriovorax antillogorgiicola]|uniref:Response regulator receiver domain-containing protein n=1 Tax=Pseudobacteriovorax antillogorgiicola TaxID=1513793 RepID=A0A1Y6CIC6_9BACT|nr:response regulator [Pseudobacteriovorax antillogorgiicola]TCS48324.1 response regulator receiver domain-containing protein [Pseudobacteriovorax antillogorgiicola]SMF56581.1 Response regulator receiver domain-containing protein [Pseudobacteriovorax antillogorgiicola]
MTITVIDDDENILELYSDYLETLGYQDVKLYQDSKPFQAQSFVDDVVKESSVILCDIRMPDVDGKEIMDRVIESRKTLGKYVLFIFISGIPKDYYPCTSDGWGALVKADDMIGKPITLDEMKQVLELHGIFPMNGIVADFDEDAG